MVCTANDLLGWKDFPKGLRVLLLDEDTDSATQITSKLEEMDYVGQFPYLNCKWDSYFTFIFHFYSNSSYIL